MACVCMQESEKVFGNVPDRDPGAGGGRDVGSWVNVMPVREEGPGIAGGQLPGALRTLPRSIPDSTAAFRSLIKSSGLPRLPLTERTIEWGQRQGLLLWRTRGRQPMVW